MAINWNSPAVIMLVRRGALKGIGSGIGIVETRAIELILQKRKTGRIYSRRGRKHQASAPGEPFASDTGQTINSRDILIYAEELRARLTFRGWNAYRMEHGTKKMAARPYARRALAETRQQVQDEIFRAILAEMRKGRR